MQRIIKDLLLLFNGIIRWWLWLVNCHNHWWQCWLSINLLYFHVDCWGRLDAFLQAFIQPVLVMAATCHSIFATPNRVVVFLIFGWALMCLHTIDCDSNMTVWVFPSNNISYMNLKASDTFGLVSHDITAATRLIHLDLYTSDNGCCGTIHLCVVR